MLLPVNVKFGRLAAPLALKARYGPDKSDELVPDYLTQSGVRWMLPRSSGSSAPMDGGKYRPDGLAVPGRTGRWTHKATTGLLFRYP